MSRDFIAPVLGLLAKTTGTAEGMGSIINATYVAVADLDIELVDLLMQRDRLVAINQTYRQMHKAVTGVPADSDDIPSIPYEAHTQESVRLAVLNAADVIAKSSNPVTVDSIFANLEERKTKLPWANPKAVIGTVLVRSGKWRKDRDGNYILR